ncbi:gp33 family protein [Ruminococcus callidus]
MAETETQNFTRAGTMFALTTKTRASAVAGRKEELYAASERKRLRRSGL